MDGPRPNPVEGWNRNKKGGETARETIPTFCGVVRSKNIERKVSIHEAGTNQHTDHDAVGWHPRRGKSCLCLLVAQPVRGIVAIVIGEARK